LQNYGLHIAANLHDADGVGSYEAMYTQMAQAVGINPATNETVPFNLVNESWAYSLEDIVLKAVEDQGMDFWWIDWQQGGTPGGCTGGKQNPTIWSVFYSNYLCFNVCVGPITFAQLTMCDVTRTCVVWCLPAGEALATTGPYVHELPFFFFLRSVDTRLASAVMCGGWPGTALRTSRTSR
jgi:hypothetical protein